MPAFASDEVPAGACPFICKDAPRKSHLGLRILNVLPTAHPGVDRECDTAVGSVFAGHDQTQLFTVILVPQ
jgi:hypothetical protein